MTSVDELLFSTGCRARTIRVNRNADLYQSLNQLGLSLPCPTLVSVGGASGIDEAAMEQLRSLFTQVLAPLAQELGLVVVDGGTDAGVMQLMGQARHHTGATFPLLGVAATGTVFMPGEDPIDDCAPLEPHHSHFMLVPGALWGDEAPWIARVASALSGSRPSFTVLVNGGKIAWQDVENSVREERAVVVIAGSGRTADEMALAVRGDRSSERANALVDSGLLHAVDLFAGIDTLKSAFRQIMQPVLKPSSA